LSVDDLPSGFVKVSLPDAGGLGVDGCPLLDTGHSSDVDAQAAVAFTRGSVVVGETILQTSESNARQSMSKLARVPGECREFTAKIEGLDFLFTPSVLDFAPIGEETVALRLTAQFAGLPAAIEEHVVTVRRGGTILIVSHVAPGSVDRVITESITHAAFEKVTRQR
jgi:hypothetical protein